MAAVGQLRQPQPLQPLQAIQTTLRASKGLLGATWLLWLLNGAVVLTMIWIFNRSEPPAWQSLGGLLMIALVAGFMYYWWVRWTFLTQVVIEEGCGPAAAFTRSSQLVANHWWRAFGLSTLLSTVPSLLDNLLNLAGPWAVVVGQGLTAPLSTLGMTLLYWELWGRGEEHGGEAAHDRP